MGSNPDGPELTYLLEVQRGMMRVCFEQLKILVCEFTNRIRKRTVMPPEAR
jgi:hypothetical protein